MNVEGQLDIQLTHRAYGVSDAALHSGRPLQASRILEGSTPEEALQRLPLIFSLCGTAQAAAALGACEDALALTPSRAQRIAREMLVWMESAREHLLRIRLDWPSFADEAVTKEGLQPVMQLLPNLTRALYADTAPFRFNTVPSPDAVLAKQVITELRNMIDELLGGALPDTRSSFDRWLKQGGTMPARLMQKLREQEWDRLGNIETNFLPSLEEDELHEYLGNSKVETFVAEPTWHGLPCETSPLQRQHAHPLLRELTVNQGNGLLTRLMARVVELAMIPDLLQLSLSTLMKAPMTTGGKAASSGTGLALVEAARGRLVHRVEIEYGVIRRFNILAPTEWNFHPQGIAVQGLRTLKGDDETALRQQAALWINAIDPCVGFNLQVRHDA